MNMTTKARHHTTAGTQTAESNQPRRVPHSSASRRPWAVATSLIAGLALPMLGSSAVTNAGGGYPYDGAVDCSAQFGASSWCIDENRNGSFSREEQFSPTNYSYRNCTDYVATRAAAFGVTLPDNLGNAGMWDDNARALGWAASTTPRPRSIAVSNAGTFGHVAFVESVNADGSVNVSEYNRDWAGTYGTRTVSASTFVYVYVPGLTQNPVAPPTPTMNLAQYANRIVKWDGNATASWFVTPDLKRLWIPDGGTFNELRARGFGGPIVLPASTLDQLPDQANQWVASGSQWGANRTLRRGMEVRSADGRYRFVMQHDGNLVLYGPTGRATWATSFLTGSWRSQEFVIFQGDGNLVTYGGGRAIWASGTGGRGGSRLAIQSDGNLVIYVAAGAIWSSGTAGRT